MTERTVDIDGAELAVQTFGDPAHPPILLVAGNGASMEDWHPGFCERLAAGSRFVVRYDHRDTGRSVHYPPGEPGYTSANLVTDAAGVVDTVCGGAAHVVGISMGGAIAQELAIDHPHRVTSLTLLATSPGGPGLAGITAPTLVLHGTEDPLFPLGHGEELPRRVWDVVVPAILRHTSGGWEDQAGRLAAGALADGEPTAWFERLYTQATGGAVDMPWDRREASLLLTSWARDRVPVGKRALVVGCGLGADAEFVASLGFDTTAFDVAETAVELARARYPESTVDYRVADLLHPPGNWFGSFDLVVEVFTVQALPEPLRGEAIGIVPRLVAPGGTLLVVAAPREEHDEPEGPPWPLTRSELDGFTATGLEQVRVEVVDGRWRAEYRAP